MRYVRLLLIIILSIILLNVTSENVRAMKTGFATEPLEEDVKDTILDNINISILKREPQKRSIDRFDVNENGLIAIACSDDSEKIISIYTSDGVFQYGYSIETSGTIGVGWDTSNLIIYLVRSSVAISITPEGEIIEILGISDTMENNSYWLDYVHATHRTVGDKEYILKCDMGIFNVLASKYSQLIVKDSEGIETVIYDVNSMQTTYTIVAVIGIIIYVCVSLIVIVKVSISQKVKTPRE